MIDEGAGGLTDEQTPRTEHQIEGGSSSILCLFGAGRGLEGVRILLDESHWVPQLEHASPALAFGFDGGKHTRLLLCLLFSTIIVGAGLHLPICRIHFRSHR